MYLIKVKKKFKKIEHGERKKKSLLKYQLNCLEKLDASQWKVTLINIIYTVAFPQRLRNWWYKELRKLVFSEAEIKIIGCRWIKKKLCPDLFSHCMQLGNALTSIYFSVNRESLHIRTPGTAKDKDITMKIGGLSKHMHTGYWHATAFFTPGVKAIATNLCLLTRRLAEFSENLSAKV